MATKKNYQDLVSRASSTTTYKRPLFLPGDKIAKMPSSSKNLDISDRVYSFGDVEEGSERIDNSFERITSSYDQPDYLVLKDACEGRRNEEDNPFRNGPILKSNQQTQLTYK